uniref:Sodium-dependent multivitamin transporter n=1 Tax=Macrostomum lignano TaxID=282301 RepID=A0A1I8IS11_9PLAT
RIRAAAEKALLGLEVCCFICCCCLFWLWQIGHGYRRRSIWIIILMMMILIVQMMLMSQRLLLLRRCSSSALSGFDTGVLHSSGGPRGLVVAWVEPPALPPRLPMPASTAAAIGKLPALGLPPLPLAPSPSSNVTSESTFTSMLLFSLTIMATVVFHWLDYLIFALVLLISASIGIAYHRQRSSKDIFLGSRQMTLMPVTFSVMASFISAISILGTTAEVYQSGVQYIILGISYFLAFPITAEVYMPVLYRNRVLTAQHYLELRFSSAVRTAASIVFCIQMFFYQAVVLYASAITFQQVTGLSFPLTMVLTGVVCTFYTALGGIKAVMWTDLVQMIIVFVAFCTLVVMATMEVGGFERVFEMAAAGDRLNFFNFNPDPTVRHSFWTLLFGGTGMCLTIYSANQAQLQRYLSCSTESVARRAIYLQMPLTFLFLCFLCLAGLVIYAFYSDCDPLLSGDIVKRDQLLPALVVRLFSARPGVTGLFVSCIFSASLSTVSSGINSLSSVVLEDLIKPWQPNLTERAAGWAARVLAVVLGLSTVGIGFLATNLPATVLQIVLSLFGIVGGPLLAVFSLGILVPWCNRYGALTGLLASLATTLGFSIAALIDPPPPDHRVFGTEGCYNGTDASNYTISTEHYSNWTVTTASLVARQRPVHWLSYLYYTPLALLVAMATGLAVSALTGFNRAK